MTFESETKMNPVLTTRPVEFWPLVRYHYFLIICTTLIGVGLGYLYFLRTPSIFESKCQLFVRNDSKQNSIPFQGTENATPTGRETPHASIIVTPLIVEKALDKEVSTHPGNDQKIKLRDLPLLRDMSHQVVYITSRLGARPSVLGGAENHELLNLTFRSTDATVSKAVLEAVVDSYKDFLGETQKSGSLEVFELIVNARDSILNHLRAVEDEYAELKKSMPLLIQDAKGGGSQLVNLHKLRMADIETERAKLLIVLNQRRAELQSIQHVIDAGGSREAIALMFKTTKADGGEVGAELNSSASEIFKLILEYQLLLEDLGSDHPKVKSLQKKIELTRSFYEKELSAEERPKRTAREDFVKVCLDALKFEISSTEAKIMQLDVLFEDESYSAKAIASYEDRNEYYQKELSRTDALYQRVMKRLDEINAMRDVGGYKVNVISPARIGHHVTPVFNQCLMIGAVLGALVGFGIGYLAEANDRTFHSPEEVSQQLNLPVVGHVAVITHDRLSASKATDSRLDKMLVTVFNPKSSISESYRGIRSSLYFSTRGQHKVIQVTSPNPGDGKTTLCANLAVSIAQSGKRVVIIDADFRRPRVHDLFGLEKSIGMSSVIAGDAELPDAIQATEVENLWGLPCGPRPDNPSELLTSRRFEELLDVLREQYDIVLIDTPPVLAVTDPGAVAARVDGVILTIRLSKRTRREAMRATEILLSVGGNVLGVVINGNMATSGSGYGRYNGYYGVYQYRYGSGSGYAYQYSYEADDKQESTASDNRGDSRRRRRQRS